MYNETMNSKPQNNYMLWITAYATLTGTALGTLIGRGPGQPFIPILLVFITIGVIMAFQEKCKSIRGYIIYLTLLTLATSSLHFLNVPSGLFLVIFFVISAQAMMMLPGWWGYLWIFLLAVISMISFTINDGFQEAVLLMMVYSGGYLFFGIFGQSLIETTAAKDENKRLYEELQETHAQLQQSVQQMQELAVTKERSRLAREMHDSIGHRLTVSAVQLEGAQRLVDKDPQKSKEMIRVVRQQVREALAELRSTVTALRQPIELDLPLGQALERLVESFETASELEINLSMPEMPILSDQYRHIIYRSVQESLTNIQRHAEATQAWIHMKNDQSALSLTISDNGKGFPEKPHESGYGLRGIIERVSLAEGECHFENRPAGGAQISIQLPLEGGASHD